MVNTSVSINDLEVKKSLKRLIKKTPALSRDILSFISEAVVNRTVIHTLSGQILKRQTGTLAKSINYRLKNDFKSTVGTNVKYAAIHEFGGIIRPTNNKYLRFKIKDSWVMTKEVVMPKRPYLYPSLQYVMQNEAKDIFNKRTDLWLDKEWKVK